MAKDTPNTQATAPAPPRPGPPAGPKIRFIRESQPFRIGQVTNRFPYDSCVRLLNERTIEVVDEKEFADYKATHERRLAEQNAAFAEKLRVERERIERQQRHELDRAIKPGETVTR